MIRYVVNVIHTDRLRSTEARDFVNERTHFPQSMSWGEYDFDTFLENQFRDQNVFVFDDKDNAVAFAEYLIRLIPEAEIVVSECFHIVRAKVEVVHLEVSDLGVLPQ